MPVMHELGDRGRGHADPEFVVLDFLGNADEHGACLRVLKTARGAYRRKWAAGTLALAPHLSLCYKRLSTRCGPHGPCESARIHKGRRMSSIGRLKALSFATAAVLALGSADAGTLDKVRQDKAIRIAFRDDAPPFSFT